MSDPRASLLFALADDELILGHRLSEWTGWVPYIEEDLALSSIAQDEIAHARMLLDILSVIDGRDPDALALGRTPGEYRAHLTEALARADVPAHFARGALRPDPSGRAYTFTDGKITSIKDRNLNEVTIDSNGVNYRPASAATATALVKIKHNGPNGTGLITNIYAPSELSPANAPATTAGAARCSVDPSPVSVRSRDRRLRFRALIALR